MGEWVKIKAVDGHELGAYVAKPQGESRGGVVVVQEIFGVNPSIRGVVDWLAGKGYTAIAPAIFDRIERDLELGYGEADMKKAFSIYPGLDPDVSLKDVAAAFKYIQAEGKGTAVMGFCYGGLVTWCSATRGPANGFTPSCAVCYYPGGIGKVAQEEPVCPVMIHLGGSDDHIGADQIDPVRKAHPEVQIYSYEGAGHAFANPNRSSYVAEAAKVADERSLEFLKTHLG